jgi:4-hydroxy-tetrahydrodipicolinate synthase
VPIVLYNIPGRSVVELSVESALKILELCPNVVCIKDASGNVLWCQDLLGKSGDRVSVLSGDDVLTLPLMSVGAKGVISVTSNLYPRQVAENVADVLAGRWADAQRKHRALFPVHRALFTEPNPQPVKAALALKGRMRASVRPPMIEASPGCRERVAAAMAAYEAT